MDDRYGFGATPGTSNPATGSGTPPPIVTRGCSTSYESQVASSHQMPPTISQPATAEPLHLQMPC